MQRTTTTDSGMHIGSLVAELTRLPPNPSVNTPLTRPAEPMGGPKAKRRATLEQMAHPQSPEPLREWPQYVLQLFG
jgi:hypothetical protein